MAQTAQQLAKQYGINNSTLKSIRNKAEQGISMDTPTKEKQAVYNAYQNYYTNEITRKAKAGESLGSPNAWKNNLYEQASLNLSSNDQAYYNTNNIMLRQNNKSQGYLDSQNELLQQNANTQLQSAEANYAKIRDEQIAGIQAELDQAVADGKLSVQEAETQFENQKEAIYAQNYLDSEYSKAQAQQRGIQNSQQFMGMEQTRQANTTSLLNSNMTERDSKIFQINTRLSQLSGDALRNINLARTGYNYNVAGAEADINSQMFQNQFNMSAEEYNRLQNLQGQLDMTGLQQKYTEQNLATQQQYTQQNMALEQQYALQQMSQQQKYTLEQMAKQYGYDINKMSIQQKYTLAQMAEQYGYDLGLQTNSQRFQASQNKLDRTFQANQNRLDRQQQTDMANLNHDLQKKYDDYSYEQQRQREYNAYNVSSSTEYKIRDAQHKLAWSDTQMQTIFGIMTDVQMNGLATRMNSLPSLSINPTQKQIDSYNKQVNNINTYLKQISPNDEMYNMFKVPTYAGGSSTTQSSSSSKYKTYQQMSPRGAAGGN